MSEDSKVSKDALFDSIVRESQGFHNQLITIASAFFAGTLFFIEKLIYNLNVYSLLLLIFGWLALIISILLSVHIRLNNLESGRLALEEKYNDAAHLDRKKEKWSKYSAWLLVIGMISLTFFGSINLYYKIRNERNDKMEESNNEQVEPLNQNPVKKIIADQDKDNLSKGSIPYGSTGPQKPEANLKPDQSETEKPANTPDKSDNESDDSD